MAGLAASAAERLDLSGLGPPGEPPLTRYAVDQMAHDVVLDLSKAATQGWRARWTLDDYLATLRL
jgi:hypothetical protein